MGAQSRFKALFAAVSVLGLSAARPASASTIVNGSGIVTTFTAAASGTVTFQYDLYTSNKTEPNGSQDYAYYTLNGQTFLLGAQNSIASTSTSPGNPVTGYTASVPIPVTAGSVTLGFGVVNIGNTNDFTALLLDNIKVNGTLILNGGFEDPTDFNHFSTVGNASIQLDVGNVSAPEGFQQALLSNSSANASGGTIDPTTSIAALAAGTGSTVAQLQTIADALNPAAAVPLPVGVYVAPLGIAMAGLFIARTRRAAVA